MCNTHFLNEHAAQGIHSCWFLEAMVQSLTALKFRSTYFLSFICPPYYFTFISKRMVSLFKIPLVDATIAYIPEDKDKK